MHALNHGEALTGVTQVAVRTPTRAFTAAARARRAAAAHRTRSSALAWLGSCQAITCRLWAEDLGISFGKLTVTVEGDLDIRNFPGFDDGASPGFSTVRVQIGITGQEPPERYQQLAAAVDEHCPVLDLFRNLVPVDSTITVR